MHFYRLHFTTFMRTDTREKGDFKRDMFWQAFYVILGLGYLVLILPTIVATANHYFLDAMVAASFVTVRIFFVGLVADHRKEAMPFRCRCSCSPPCRALPKAACLASYPATLGAQPSKF